MDIRQCQQVIVSSNQGEIKDFCGRGEEMIGGISM